MTLLTGSLLTLSMTLIALSTIRDHNQPLFSQEDFMHELLDRFRRWRASVLLAGTTFCESCSQVCTPACRRTARLDRYHQAASRIGPFRF